LEQYCNVNNGLVKNVNPLTAIFSFWLQIKIALQIGKQNKLTYLVLNSVIKIEENIGCSVAKEPQKN